MTTLYQKIHYSAVTGMWAPFAERAQGRQRKTSLSTVTGGAVFRHGAAFAFGTDRAATGLAEGYDMRVPRLPVFDRQDLT